jgi:hypothetical protein
VNDIDSSVQYLISGGNVGEILSIIPEETTTPDAKPHVAIGIPLYGFDTVCAQPVFPCEAGETNHVVFRDTTPCPEPHHAAWVTVNATVDTVTHQTILHGEVDEMGTIPHTPAIISRDATLRGKPHHTIMVNVNVIDKIIRQTILSG